MDANVIQDRIMVRGIAEHSLAQACGMPLRRVRSVIDGDDRSQVSDVQRVCAVLGLNCDVVVRDNAGC